MNGKGQTTVEFALVAVLLLTILFAIVDLSVLFYVERTVQEAVREGARYAITGQRTETLNRRQSMQKVIEEASRGLLYQNKLPEKDPTVCVLIPSETRNFSNYSGYRCEPIGDTGGPNDILVVSLTYSWPLMTPFVKPFFNGDTYTFTTRVTMKNEPWGDNVP
jgi:type II secretory pathway pseudopilin PulG